MKLLKVFAAAVLTIGTAGAQASLISLDGAGVSQSVATNNDFFGDGLTFATYDVGSNASATDNVWLKYTFLGRSASWNQEFWVDGSIGIDSATKTAYSNVAAHSLLDFKFVAFPWSGGTFQVANGANQGASMPSFASVLGVWHMDNYYDAIFLFDDTGGNPEDTDYDDFVIGVQAIVPEPSILLLMGLGLISLFGARKLKA